MLNSLTVLLIYLLLVLVPMLAGYAVMKLLRRRRGDKPVDYGPWKIMAMIAAAPTLLLVTALIWTSYIPMDYAEFKSPMSLRAQLINALTLISFLMPSAYLGAAMTGAITGVARPRAYIWVFALLAPVLFVGWYALVLALSCVTTGACL